MAPNSLYFFPKKKNGAKFLIFFPKKKNGAKFFKFYQNESE